ncbi:MAG: LCP family protein [Chloroflexi bacterium]|jgi:LCP family protein required for cell wall assembly|nr:LCP family protein [Chloroflexota bacterium]
MEEKRTLPTQYARLLILTAGLIMAIAFFISCNPDHQGRPSLSDTQTILLPEETQIPGNTPTLNASSAATRLPWPTFAEPNRASVTQIPPAVSPLELNEDVRVWLLLGTELEAPNAGRTDAIHLIFINERLSKASVVSVPGNLFVYLPGHNMQRINSAYALGGMPLLRDTLAYNFGIRPDRFVLAHKEEFSWLVDDMGGIEVSVLFAIRDDCDGLPAGLHHMNGNKTLCYVSYLKDGDEVDRTYRQQQVLQLLFTKLVQDGRLAELPAMYLSYQDKMETDISLADFLQRIPLALRLGDPQRISYFVIGWESASLWELPDHTKTRVLLPDLEAMAKTFAQAASVINESSPLGEIVVTYQWQLTEAIAGTQTRQPLDMQTTAGVPSRTPTPRPTRTPLPPVYTPASTAIIATSTPLTPYP